MTSAPTPFAFYGILQSARNDRGGLFGRETDLGTYGPDVLIRGDLYDVGAFPALRPGSGIVKGQLWTPHPDCVEEATSIFDRIEGYNPARPEGSMYLRCRVQLVQPEVWANIYIWNRAVTSLAPIPDGDWLAHQQASARYEVV